MHITAEYPNCFWDNNKKEKTEMQLNYSLGPFALQALFALQRLATKIREDHPVLSTTT